MPWVKAKENKWNYKSGDLQGYIMFVKYKNGTKRYEGIVWNNKTHKVSTAVTASTLTACKAAVQKKANALK